MRAPTHIEKRNPDASRIAPGLESLGIKVGPHGLRHPAGILQAVI
jgi:hypothetical protein